MKKTLAIVITALLCITFSAVTFASDPEACDHTDSESSTLIKIKAENSDSCMDAGIKEYWECIECGKFFSDQEGTEISDLDAWRSEGGDGYIEPSHTLVHIDGVAASCDDPGTKEYWECSKCGKFFSDQEGTEISDLDAWRSEGGDGYIEPSHTLVHVDEKTASCFEAGTKEYWECSVCGKSFSDDQGENEIPDLGEWKAEGGDGYIASAGAHDLEEVGAVEATCTKIGSHHHWYCSRCGKYFSDDQGENEITEAEAIIPKKEHAISNGKCTKCGGKEDVVKKEDGNWYYVVGNDIQTNYTGIKPNKNGWWRIVKGKVDFNCTSVEKNENGWWYIKDGKVQFDYTGIKSNKNGSWRIVKGKVDFNCTSVVKSGGDWWYIKGGKVQFDYTGIKPNNNGWWRIVKGKVDFNCTSVEKNENGWWYIKDGKVQFNYTGIKPNKNGWWRIVKGKVDFNCNTIEQNEKGWWYCNKGKVDFGYTGFGHNQYGWWYVENGKVTFKKYGIVHGSIAGVVDDWHVYGSQVDTEGKTMLIKAQSYSSSTKWLILVDCYENNMAIFYGSKGHWSLKQFWRCSTGAGNTKTPKGVFQIQYKLYSFSGPDTIANLTYSNPLCYTVYWASNFASGGYFIHSTLYRYQSWDVMDASLGGNVSHGCIRLGVANANWIYENIPYGTTVVTY